MDYYGKKALMEALYLECPPPTALTGYFRVVKEVYAHERFDLARALCDALCSLSGQGTQGVDVLADPAWPLLSRGARGEWDEGSGSGAGCSRTLPEGKTEQRARETAAFESICKALAFAHVLPLIMECRASRRAYS